MVMQLKELGSGVSKGGSNSSSFRHLLGLKVGNGETVS